MKNSFLILLGFLTFLLCNAQTATAGIAIRKQTVVAATTPVEWTSGQGLTGKELRKEQLQAISSFVLHEGHHPRTRKCSANGWEGTAAMWCGIGSIFMPPTLILAIVFGALGIGEGHKHRGRATAGLVIGVAGIFLIAMAITLSAVM